MVGSAEEDHLLTIGDLAERTGVPPRDAAQLGGAQTGFPRPVRLAGGHRRYTEQDVVAVLDVVRHRGSGLALEAAVRPPTASGATPVPGALYAELRRRHPRARHSDPLAKRSLLALAGPSRQVLRARRGAGALRRASSAARFLRGSYARWVELARTARAAVVFAEPGHSRDPPARLPVEVPLPTEAPLSREWIVLCDAPDLPTCLVAVDRGPARRGCRTRAGAASRRCGR